MVPRLLGEKVDLRAPSLLPKDILKLVEFNQNEEVLMWTGRNTHISTKETCEEWIKKCLEDENDCLFFIYDKEHDILVGSCNLRYKYNHSTNVELGILLGIDYVNQGFGTDTIKTLLKFAFDEMHAHRVMLHADEANSRAIKAYTNCGFVQCGLEHETNWARGMWHNTVTMEILDRDYYNNR